MPAQKINLTNLTKSLASAIAISVGVVVFIATIDLAFADFEENYTIQFSDGPSLNSRVFESPPVEIFRDYRFGDCQWLGKGNYFAALSCTTRQSESFPDALFNLRQQGWEIVSYHVQVYQSPSRDNLFLTLVFTGAPLLTGLFLLRHIPVREELYTAAEFLRSRPWILLLPIATSAVVSATLFSFTGTPHEAGEQQDPIQWARWMNRWPYLLFAAPLFEEAVFRQWFYRKVIRQNPTWLCGLASAWGFTLMHAFNTSADVLHLYLPVIFVLGVTFFFIRLWSQSILLTILAHAFNNAVVLILAAFHQQQI